LKRILANLAEELGAPLVRLDGERLVTQRPTGGWQSFDQIRGMALGGSFVKSELLRPYLLLDAWVDLKVIRPTATRNLLGKYPKGWAEITRGSSDDGPGTMAYFTAGRSAPVPGFEPRAPVSLSWARLHKPALVALLRDLEGVFLHEAWHSVEAYDNTSARGNCIGLLTSLVVTTAEARRIADRMAVPGLELSTWQAFQDFCDALPDAVFVVANPQEIKAKKDMIKANFNPNSDLNKFNPNPTLWKSVDKMDLLVYSTEFSLYPQNGHLASAAGRFSGSVRVLKAALAGPQAIRLTTQKEFVGNSLGLLQVAGDEGGLRQPGWTAVGAPDFITQSKGDSRTWGHRLNTTGAYSGGWMDLDSQGLSLQTYPEPCLKSAGPEALSNAAANYDGNLQLATVETVDGALYNVPGTPPDLRCLARFNDDLALDVHPFALVSDADNQPDTWQPPLTNSLMDPVRPNTLFPDGCYAERNRAPGYLDRGNVNGFHGLLSFWMKPNYEGRISRRGREYFRWTNYSGADPQFFFLGWYSKIRCRFEIDHFLSDQSREHEYTTPDRNLDPRRWYLVTFFWDTQATVLNDHGELLLDDGIAALDRGSPESYPNAGVNPGATDFTLDAPEDGVSATIRPHKFFLGKRGASKGSGNDRTVGNSIGTGADATFDELAIWDFGQNAGSANILAASRYGEGRYYKGWVYTDLGTAPVQDQAGSWFSAPISLPSASVVRQIHWTWYRPPSLPQDFAEMELTTPSGSAYLLPEAESRSSKAFGWNRDLQSWRVFGRIPGPFRLHAVFRRPAALPAGAPILDSPVLDDLTLLYAPQQGQPLVSFGDE